jgi:hypothetical protein
MKTIRVCLLVALFLLALPVSVAADDTDLPMESANYAITWCTLEEDHGGSAESASFVIETAVVGQMIAHETSRSDAYFLCAGFSCFPLAEHQIFLPLILRQ